jgi:hypothetical protein
MILSSLFLEAIAFLLQRILAYFLILPIIFLFVSPIILFVAAFQGRPYWRNISAMHCTVMKEIMILFLQT